MGTRLGTVFVELDINDSQFTRKERQILEGAKSSSLAIEKNWRTLGQHSNIMYDAMRQQAINAYVAIKNNAKTTSEEIVRAERAKNQQIAEINRQQYEKTQSAANMHAAAITRAILRIYAAYYALKSAMDAIANSVFGYMATVETSALGMAAAYMTGGKYIDETTGRILKGREAFTAAQKDTANVMKELQVANLQTIATLDQLIRGYQQTLPIALAKGFNKDQVLQFTKAVVQAAGAIDPALLYQLGEETRAMLTGNISQRNSRIAVALGLRPEDIRQYQNNADELYTFLMKKLDAYTYAGVESMKTWEGLWSNTADIAKQAGSIIFGSAFESIKYTLSKITEDIITIDEKTKQMKFNDSFVAQLEGIKIVVNSILSMITGIAGAFKLVGSAMGRVAGFWNAARTSNATPNPFEGLGDEMQTYGDIISGLWKDSDNAISGNGSGIKYVANKAKPDEATIKAQTDATENWVKKLRDLQTEIDKAAYGTDTISDKILDIENKYSDLMQTANKAMRDHKIALNTTLVETWKQAMIANAEWKNQWDEYEFTLKIREDGERKYTSLMNTLNESMADAYTNRIQKSIDTETNMTKELISIWAATELSYTEYQNVMAQIEAKGAREREDIALERANKIREASLNYELGILDIAEKQRSMGAYDIVKERLRITDELIKSQEQYLNGIDRIKDPTGWLTQMNAINQLRASFALLTKEMEVQAGTLQGGIINGLKNYQYEMKTAYEYGNEVSKNATDTMKESFASLFQDSYRGELKNFLEYFQDFTNKILDKWSDMLAEMLTNWIWTNQTMKSQSTGSSLGGLGGILSNLFGGSYTGTGSGVAGISGNMFGDWTMGLGFHGGGQVGKTQPAFTRYVPESLYYNAPRYKNGLMPDEYPAILHKKEWVIPDKYVRHADNGGNSNVFQINITAVDAKSFTDLCRRTPQAITSVMTDAMINNEKTRKTMKRTL